MKMGRLHLDFIGNESGSSSGPGSEFEELQQLGLCLTRDYSEDPEIFTFIISILLPSVQEVVSSIIFYFLYNMGSQQMVQI